MASGAYACICGLAYQSGCTCAQDRDEATLELSLFAEAFQEMLSRHYGERILQALYAERWAPSACFPGVVREWGQAVPAFDP